MPALRDDKPEVQEAVCKALAEGLSLRKACKAHDIEPSTILRWCDSDPEFAQQYARARDVGYRLLADEIIDISDDGTNDSYTDDDGNERTNQDVIARSRLRVDSRKWMLSKMLPKLYGDKLDVDLKGTMAVTLQSSDDAI